MRFTTRDDIHITKLNLDEHNYRFISASDQGECIEKIYDNNASNFINMMQSIVEHDLDQPLLVYKNKHDKLWVADGNRRAAALKVLHNPELAPSNHIKQKAKDLLTQYKFKSFDISSYISTNYDLVMLTVYERHAAGKGITTIKWDAFGAALFRYKFKQETDPNEWHSIALISGLFSKYPELMSVRNDKKYSHDVFRRLVRAPEAKVFIPDEIFDEKNQRIKDRPKARLEKALNVSKIFVDDIVAGNMTTSRKNPEKYADAKNITKYFKQLKSSKAGKENIQKNIKTVKIPVKPIKPGTPTTIEYDENIGNALNKLKTLKLSKLYYSICKVSAKEHPILIDVGCWSFLESLSTLTGKPYGHDFVSHIGNKNNGWFADKTTRQDFSHSLKYFSDNGNFSKHSGKQYNANPEEIINKFLVLTPCILKLIQEANTNP